jgi:1,2-diacylglycerol 3-beta-galactosyltransferase
MLKDRNAIFICGAFAHMKEKLERIGNDKHKILGYVDVDQMATCLRASEIVIGKPGPGVVSEAWQCECVPICEGGRVVMTQEKIVERDIKENKRGIIIDRFEDIPTAVDTILTDPTYAANCSAVENRALEQVVEVIEDVANNYDHWKQRIWGAKEQQTKTPTKAPQCLT